MSLKTIAAKIFAGYIYKKTKRWANNPIETQQHVFDDLIQKARKTQFGKDHNLDAVRTYKDFAKQVPIRDYEGLRNYVDRVVQGEEKCMITLALPI